MKGRRVEADFVTVETCRWETGKLQRGLAEGGPNWEMPLASEIA